MKNEFPCGLVTSSYLGGLSRRISFAVVLLSGLLFLFVMGTRRRTAGGRSVGMDGSGDTYVKDFGLAGSRTYAEVSIWSWDLVD